MDVQYYKTSGCFNVILGVLTLGIVPLVIWRQQRQWPARVDENGLTTRGGKQIPW